MSIVFFQNLIDRHNSQEIANRLEIMLESIEPADRELFALKNIDLIKQMWSHVHHNNEYVMIKGTRRKLKSCIDLFLKPLINQEQDVDTFRNHYCTRMFLQFIQGITLFYEDGPTDIGKPAYHRAASCGPDKITTQQYRKENLTCAGVDEAKELIRRRRNVSNCYIERIIYDRLYNNIVGEQNFKHRMQKFQVEREMFESCFHFADIALVDVFVEMNNIYVPIRCIMLFDAKTPDGKYASIRDTYDKPKLNGIVKCTRAITFPDDPRPFLFHKTATFYEKNKKWVASRHN